jgi:hypothetical protein
MFDCEGALASAAMKRNSVMMDCRLRTLNCQLPTAHCIEYPQLEPTRPSSLVLSLDCALVHVSGRLLPLHHMQQASKPGSAWSLSGLCKPNCGSVKEGPLDPPSLAQFKGWMEVT